MKTLVEKLIPLTLLATAITYPLFAVDLLKINLSIFEVSLPQIFLILFSLLGLFLGTQRPSQQNIDSQRKLIPLAIACALFWAWNLFEMTRAPEFKIAFKEMAKLSLGLLFFWALIFFFPQDRKLKRWFVVLVLGASTLVLSRLIYHYAFVYKLPFLNKYISDEMPVRVGKNQLGWFLAVITPLIFMVPGALMAQKQKFLKSLLWILSAGIIFLALIYNQSRSALIASTTSLAISLIFIACFNKSLFKMYAITLLAGLSVSILFTTLIAPRFMNLSETSTRLESIFLPSHLTEDQMYLGKYSYDNRLSLIKQGFDSFLTSPLIGSGFNFSNEWHNDHLTLLSESGFIGEVLFLFILLQIFLKTWGQPSPSNEDAWLYLSMRTSVISLYMMTLFQRSYASPFFWATLGLAMVFSRDQKGEPRMENISTLTTIH